MRVRPRGRNRSKRALGGVQEIEQVGVLFHPINTYRPMLDPCSMFSWDRTPPNMGLVVYASLLGTTFEPLGTTTFARSFWGQSSPTRIQGSFPRSPSTGKHHDR